MSITEHLFLSKINQNDPTKGSIHDFCYLHLTKVGSEGVRVNDALLTTKTLECFLVKL